MYDVLFEPPRTHALSATSILSVWRCVVIASAIHSVCENGCSASLTITHGL
jgi:hypothetical protein